MRSLGQRSLDIAQRELLLGVRERPPGSNNGPEIRKYLQPCVRDIVTQVGSTTTTRTVNLNLQSSNWCCAFACYCHANALRTGERPVHGYRAGVIELVADVKVGEGYTGRWLDVADVRSGKLVPTQGDLAVYTRAVQGRPDTAWWRHVNRVESWHVDHFIAIGGNELQKIRRSKVLVSNSRLLGFIAYPPMNVDGLTRTPSSRPMLSEDERQEILHQVAVSLDGILRNSIWRR